MGVITLNLSDEIEQYVRTEVKTRYPTLSKGGIKLFLEEVLDEYRKRHQTE